MELYGSICTHWPLTYFLSQTCFFFFVLSNMLKPWTCSSQLKIKNKNRVKIKPQKRELGGQPLYVTLVNGYWGCHFSFLFFSDYLFPSFLLFCCTFVGFYITTFQLRFAGFGKFGQRRSGLIESVGKSYSSWNFSRKSLFED